MEILKKIYRQLVKTDIRTSLIKKGASIGENFSCYGIIDNGHPNLITIGNNVTLAAGCRILTHDASTKLSTGFTKIGTVVIGNNVFIGASAIVLPGIQIGDNVIVGAGTVVSRNVASNSVVAGNPMRFIRTYEDYIIDNQTLISQSKCIYDCYWTDMTEEEYRQQADDMKHCSIGWTR